MARPVSRASQTLQDYGDTGSGTGGEKSTWQFWITTLTAGNFAAQSGLVSTLLTAVLDITRGSQAASNLLASSTRSAVNNTDPLAQRENKWLVRYHDANSVPFTLEIPTADAALLDQGNEFLDLTGTEAAAFKTAFEAVVKSPDDPTLATTVDSIQFVGRRN